MKRMILGMVLIIIAFGISGCGTSSQFIVFSKKNELKKKTKIYSNYKYVSNNGQKRFEYNFSDYDKDSGMIFGELKATYNGGKTLYRNSYISA